MRLLDNSHGVSLIAAIFIIVILAFMGVIFLTMFTTSSSTSINDLQSAQALYVAEGGMEYSLLTGAFPNFSVGPISLGSGTFITVSQYIGPGGIAPATVTDNPLSAAATTINVTSTANYIIPSVILIDSEYILCTATSGGNQFTGCTRGWAGVATTHPFGVAATQSVVTSSGTAGGAVRIVRSSIGNGSTTVFSEDFPAAASVPADTAPPTNSCATSPALAWCFSYTNNQGRSLYDAANNAPASAGGSLEAWSNGTAGARIAGYRQRYLPITLSAGSPVLLSLWYKKTRGHSQTFRIDMSVNLVATDGTSYQLWLNSPIVDVPWTQAVAPVFTVPVGKTIDRIRLSFDIQNRPSGGGSTSPSYVWFDGISLANPGGASLLSWQEVVN